MSLVTVKDAATVWKYLNGVINVYKPAGLTVQQVRHTIIGNLCRDLNELRVRPPLQRVAIASGAESRFVVRTVEDISDNVLVVGPRYQTEDLRVRTCTNHGRLTSGVLVLGINKGLSTVFRIQQNRPLRVYRITGFLGKATESHFGDSRVIAKATVDHIGSDKISRLLASMQASHQKKMFELCGVDMQSQAAYDLAVKGTIRPADNSQPMIYGIRLAEFRRPFFTIEIHAINETEPYLGQLVHEIGLGLKSVAHCVAIRCIRHGHFELDKSLLRHDWNLQCVLAGMASSRQLLQEHPEMLHQTSTELVGIEQSNEGEDGGRRRRRSARFAAQDKGEIYGDGGNTKM
ncbi:mitochondrial mRNA pseudouridine synthase Trub2 [Culex quinquefasciatus]|uniref:mitochondrial mRNA pseudouridine synthase Trub2 n=1 Tax=Culex quinquefasciatus TaxID=7176 RepID=UPI0018E3CE3C|nr:mitochondrial mRNA pseudouridine synthase Trub2 [Culex quinquefasciatus]